MHDSGPAAKKSHAAARAMGDSASRAASMVKDWREVASDVRGRALPCGTSFRRRSRREFLAEAGRFLEAQK